MKEKKLLFSILFICICSFEALAQNAWLIPYKSGKLWGLSDTNGKLVIQPKYEAVDFAYENRIRFMEKGLYGYLNTQGKVVIQPKYKEAQNFNTNFFSRSADNKEIITAIVKDIKNKRFLIDLNGKEIQSIEMDDEPPPAQEQFAIDYNKLKIVEANFQGVYDSVRYADFEGTETSPANYKVFKKGKIGLMNKDLEITITPHYDKLEFYSDDLIIAKEGKSFQIIDENDQRKYPSALDSIAFSSYGIWIHIRVKGKWGISGVDNRIVIAPLYDQIYSYLNSENLKASNSPIFKGYDWMYSDHFVIVKNGKKGIYHQAKNYTIDPAYREIFSYIDYNPKNSYDRKPTTIELYYVKTVNGQEGFINRTGTKRFFK